MKLKTAKKDIVCYKVSNRQFCGPKTFESFYYHYKYTIGRKASKRTPLKIKFTSWNKRTGIINRGFHSYIHEPGLPTEQRIKCVIPKGTEYYVNTRDGSRVSTAIKPIEYLKN